MVPSIVRRATPLLAMGALYGIAAGFAILVSRLDDGVAFMWIATGVLVARLAVLPRREWPGVAIACAVGSALATGLLGVGWIAAGPLAIVNVGEGLIGTWMLRRLSGAYDPMDSLRWLGGFIVAVGVIGPFVGGLGAGVAMALVADQPSAITVSRWYIGHALGTLTVTPILLLAFRMKPSDWRALVHGPKTVETLALLGLVLATCVGVFMQSTLPLLFLPMLPVMLATFRGGRVAAAMSLVVVAVVGGISTAANHGPVAMIDWDAGARLQVFQFYLATTVLAVLPIAADLSHRARLFRNLRESEARYRLVTEHSTDIVLNIDLSGVIRFCSPSIESSSGFKPEDVVGRSALRLVDRAHRAEVGKIHAQAMRDPSRTFIVEYLARTASGTSRWYETHVRAVVEEHGRAVGVVSAVRDIAHRKAVEDRLSHAAMTDALTGLANRRAFFAGFGRAIGQAAEGTCGCIAMLDLDRFKQINDQRGHAGGDAVLQQFARVAGASLRHGDTLARIGGEEFAILLPGASIRQARAVVDRIRRSVRSSPTTHEGVSVFVTVSAGLARYDGSEPVAAVLARADTALYAAKAKGRDRLSIAA